MQFDGSTRLEVAEECYPLLRARKAREVEHVGAVLAGVFERHICKQWGKYPDNSSTGECSKPKRGRKRRKGATAFLIDFLDVLEWGTGWKGGRNNRKESDEEDADLLATLQRILRRLRQLGFADSEMVLWATKHQIREAVKARKKTQREKVAETLGLRADISPRA